MLLYGSECWNVKGQIGELGGNIGVLFDANDANTIDTVVYQYRLSGNGY